MFILALHGGWLGLSKRMCLGKTMPNDHKKKEGTYQHAFIICLIVSWFFYGKINFVNILIMLTVYCPLQGDSGGPLVCQSTEQG